MNQISNIQFIATLLHIKPNQLTYTEILSLLQYWRGQPLNIQRYGWVNGSYIPTRTSKNSWGTQYLSYSPTRGGVYKRTIWDAKNRHYYLLPSGKQHVVQADTIEDLLTNYQFKGA